MWRDGYRKTAAMCVTMKVALKTYKGTQVIVRLEDLATCPHLKDSNPKSQTDIGTFGFDLSVVFYIKHN